MEDSVKSNLVFPPYTPANYQRLWIPFFVAAVLSAKRLVMSEFHYPASLSFMCFAMWLMIYTIIYLGSTVSTTEIQPEWKTQHRYNVEISSKWLLGSRVTAAIAAAGSFLLLMEAILHTPNLYSVIMLWPMIFAIEAIVVFMIEWKSIEPNVPWESITITCVSSIGFFNDYRLMVPGIVCSITGILLAGVSRALLTLSQGFSNNIELTLLSSRFFSMTKSTHTLVAVSTMAGLLFSLASVSFLEQLHTTTKIQSNFSLIFVNLISTVGAGYFSSFLSSSIPITMSRFIPLLISSCIIFVVSLLWTPAVVSWIQVATYLISITCTLGFSSTTSKAPFELQQTSRIPQIFRKEYKILTVAAFSISVLVISWIVSAISSWNIDLIAPAQPTNFGVYTSNSSRFEIVVAMYDEDLESVKAMLQSIVATRFISSIQPTVTIYSKQPDVDLKHLRKAVGADVVRSLPNRGREGGTYLYHIVNNWDNLAEQTLFIQAHAHNMRELIPRLNGYLVPNTGMLSLGFAGVSCNCNVCIDRWGWEDNWEMVPALYNKIYNQSCEPETSILLSYKGQFVASGKRIRGIERTIYKELLDAITSEKGWSHDDRMAGHKESADNPYFGFTMERIWSLLMQCATDGRIVARCPSLLSGERLGGQVEDCQCLDS